MAVKWRSDGGTMGTVDLRNLDGDQIVIHYGGALTSVDAYTFANSLVAFADTVRAVNSAINPKQNIEIRLEAVGPGSFRAVVKRIRKGFGGFFSGSGKTVFWSIVAAIIYERLFAGLPDVQIHVNTDEVIIEHGNDRVIIPRIAYEQMKNVRNDTDVQKSISRTFEVIERDDAIENFGVTERIDDKDPLVQIDRKHFATLSSPPVIATGEQKRRERTESARLIILKPWLQSGKKKWSFEWNGVPISAPITDQAFQNRLLSREYLIGAGDALDVTLRYFQDFDPALETFVNDNSTFEVVEVKGFIARDGPQRSLLD